MSQTTQNPPEDTSDREIVITRLVDAPRELVFQAWISPEHVGRWWGPNGFTITTHEMEVRPGGVWRFTMHGPDGTDYKEKISYLEVAPPERLVFDHGEDNEDASAHFHVTVTFEEQESKTKITMRNVFATPEERDATLKFGAVEGGQQTLERLDQFMIKSNPATRPFIISRVYDAPRDLVYKVWTEAGHLQHWWGPKGCKIHVASHDFRVGGIFHYRMDMPDGHAMWGRFFYRQIIPPERIVFINSFSDPEGNITRAPFFDGKWPLEILSTITFGEESGRTKVTVESFPLLSISNEERETFDSAHDSMRQGWGGTLDQLGDYLAETIR